MLSILLPFCFTPTVRRAASNRRHNAALTAVAEAPRSPHTVPCAAATPWEVHKFGGASLATPELYRTVGDLIIEEAKPSGRSAGAVPTMAVVSAMGGMTDLLIKVLQARRNRGDMTQKFRDLLKSVSKMQAMIRRKKIADRSGWLTMPMVSPARF